MRYRVTLVLPDAEPFQSVRNGVAEHLRDHGVAFERRTALGWTEFVVEPLPLALAQSLASSLQHLVTIAVFTTADAYLLSVLPTEKVSYAIN